MGKRYCHACGHEMSPMNIAVDANLGKYTVMVKGMTAHQCQKCSETVVSAEEIMALHQLEKGFAGFSKADWPPVRDHKANGNGETTAGSNVEAVAQAAYKFNDKTDLLGVKEVAELLQIAPQNVYSLIYVDKLPAVKIGNAWKFKREDVHAYMTANAAQNMA